MVSVVIATFNGEKYILNQLESIYRQTYIPDEVLIYDDCSIDKTYSIIKDFIDRNGLHNWILKRNFKNIGYKKNFYKLLSDSRGDYVFLCDQDDEWKNNKIDSMIKLMENNKIGSLGCAVELIDSNSKLISVRKRKHYYNCGFIYLKDSIDKLQKFDFEYLSKHNFTPGCTMVISRKIVDLFLKQYDYGMPHDWFINLIAANQNECFFLNEPLVRYRKHKDNAIGVGNGIINIKKKDRKNIICDYSERITAINIINSTEEKNIKEIKAVLDLYCKMIDFYRKPSIKKLFFIRKNKYYYEVTNFKKRIYEISILFNIDSILIKIMRVIGL